MCWIPFMISFGSQRWLEKHIHILIQPGFQIASAADSWFFFSDFEKGLMAETPENAP